jgi:hypothetical protein
LTLIPDNTLRGFQTADGKYWTFLLTRTSRSNWRIKYKSFLHNSNGTYEQYNPEKYITKSLSTKILTFLDEYGEIFLQVAASVIVGVLTGGSSLLVQGLAELGVNLAFAAKEYFVDKDNFGAGLSLVLGLIPMSSIGLRYGFGQGFKGLERYGAKLAAAKTIEEANVIISSLSKNEQILIKKAMQLPEKTLKMAISEGSTKIILDGISKGTIDIAKIPFTQRTWLWQTIYELSGAGVVVFNSIKFKNEMIEKETKKLVEDAQKLWSKDNGFSNPKLNSELEMLAKKYK